MLELHPLNDDDYYLGIFLVGAYQEILGDLHNLFGDTHAVQVSLAPNGGYLIDHVVSGDTVTEVLNYVSYNKDDLVARLRKFAESALRRAASPSTSRASCCASTRTGSPATRTWSARWTPRRRRCPASSSGWWRSPSPAARPPGPEQLQAAHRPPRARAGTRPSCSSRTASWRGGGFVRSGAETVFAAP